MSEPRNLKCPWCGGTGNCFNPKSDGYCPVCRGFKRLTKSERDRLLSMDYNSDQRALYDDYHATRPDYLTSRSVNR